MLNTSSRVVRRSLIAAVSVAAALSLAACSTPAADPTAAPTEGSASTPLRIGFSPFSMQIPAFIGLSQGLTAIAGGQGDTVITADANYDPSTQLQQIQQWVELDQVDAIWVIPVAAEPLAGVIQSALDKGIVVIASGVPSDYGMSEGDPGITFSNVDNKDYGDKIGTMATECINDRLDGKGQIVFLQSPSGQQSSADIGDSIKAAVASGAPDSAIVNTQDAADRLGSQQIVLSALQGAPDINTVIATDDESSLGSLDAFASAGKDSATTCIIGAGGNDEAKAAVADGKMYGLVAFDFGADIGQNVAEIHKLAADPSAPGQSLVTPILVVNQ